MYYFSSFTCFVFDTKLYIEALLVYHGLNIFSLLSLSLSLSLSVCLCLSVSLSLEISISFTHKHLLIVDEVFTKNHAQGYIYCGRITNNDLLRFYLSKT